MRRQVGCGSEVSVMTIRVDAMCVRMETNRWKSRKRRNMDRRRVNSMDETEAGVSAMDREFYWVKDQFNINIG